MSKQKRVSGFAVAEDTLRATDYSMDELFRNLCEKAGIDPLNISGNTAERVRRSFDHLQTIEDPELREEAVREFLKRVETRAASVVGERVDTYIELLNIAKAESENGLCDFDQFAKVTLDAVAAASVNGRGDEFRRNLGKRIKEIAKDIAKAEAELEKQDVFRTVAEMSGKRTAKDGSFKGRPSKLNATQRQELIDASEWDEAKQKRVLKDEKIGNKRRYTQAKFAEKFGVGQMTISDCLTEIGKNSGSGECDEFPLIPTAEGRGDRKMLAQVLRFLNDESYQQGFQDRESAGGHNTTKRKISKLYKADPEVAAGVGLGVYDKENSKGVKVIDWDAAFEAASIPMPGRKKDGTKTTRLDRFKNAYLKLTAEEWDEFVKWQRDNAN